LLELYCEAYIYNFYLYNAIIRPVRIKYNIKIELF
jgi:hypothetical protein